jgi:hypothetical protein
MASNMKKNKRRKKWRSKKASHGVKPSMSR